MSEQNYPARGKMSEDGKYYTHTDGSVHERVEYTDKYHVCDECSLLDLPGMVTHKGCGMQDFRTTCQYQRIDGAYVQSDEEREACDMARKAIETCSQYRGAAYNIGCVGCQRMSQRMCHLRKYLAAKHQPDAWEVNP